MGKVTIGARLAKYNLTEAQTPLVDLNVAANTEHVLSAQDPAIAGHMKVLHPTSIDDVKGWLGLPSFKPAAGAAVLHPVAQPAAALIPANRAVDFWRLADLHSPLPAHLTKEHTTALYAAAHQYVTSNTHGLDHAVIGNLNKWIATIKPSIIVFHFQDVHVAAGAKLVLGTSNSVLFARYVTVEKTGKIVAKASVVKIDCAGFKGN